jgi:hypothetical protein
MMTALHRKTKDLTTQIPLKTGDEFRCYGRESSSCSTSGICVVLLLLQTNRIGGVMVSVFVSCAVDRGFEHRSGQTNDYKIGICCFSAKHAALRRKSKDWLARNQNNVSEWSDMSTR